MPALAAPSCPHTQRCPSEAPPPVINNTDLCQRTRIGTRTGKRETRLNRTKALCWITWKGKAGDR